jgi:hypothetical protein
MTFLFIFPSSMDIQMDGKFISEIFHLWVSSSNTKYIHSACEWARGDCSVKQEK